MHSIVSQLHPQKTADFASIEEAIYWAIDDPLLYQELMDLLDYQYLKIDFVDKPLDRFGTDYPLDLYCSYTFDQILVALGKHTEQKKSSFREGVLYLAEKNLDVFFVTLNKSEKDYSPSTMFIGNGKTLVRGIRTRGISVLYYGTSYDPDTGVEKSS